MQQPGLLMALWFCLPVLDPAAHVFAKEKPQIKYGVSRDQQRKIAEKARRQRENNRRKPRRAQAPPHLVVSSAGRATT